MGIWVAKGSDAAGREPSKYGLPLDKTADWIRQTVISGRILYVLRIDADFVRCVCCVV